MIHFARNKKCREQILQGNMPLNTFTLILELKYLEKLILCPKSLKNIYFFLGEHPII